MTTKLLTLPLVLLSFTALNAPAYAAAVTFFGEDINTTGDPSTAAPTHSNAAKAQFFTNLAGVGTETFESFATGTAVPIAVNFPGAGTATLSVNGSIFSGSDGAGRFPISGTQYLETDAGAGFNLAFSSAIAAFGFYGTDIGDFGGQIVLTLTDIHGATSTLAVPNTIGSSGSTSGSALYFGFYDKSNTYTKIAFADTSSSDVFGFDDFSIGSTSQVVPSAPEPASYLLFGSGLAALAIVRRRWAKR